MEKTVVELFAGVGGFRIGLTNSNPDWKFVMANQWEPGKTVQHAFDCYSKHFNKFNDLNGINIATIKKDHVKSYSKQVQKSILDASSNYITIISGGSIENSKSPFEKARDSIQKVVIQK